MQRFQTEPLRIYFS